MRRMMAVAAVALMALAGSACTPTVTITAKPDSATPICRTTSWVRGKVTPADGTSKVVLQRTVGGKWVDWSWYAGTGSLEQPHALEAKVDSVGGYAVAYRVPGARTAIHLRVRSAGGGAVSPGFYVTPRQGDPQVACGL